jgi:hypothetical protein
MLDCQKQREERSEETGEGLPCRFRTLLPSSYCSIGLLIGATRGAKDVQLHVGRSIRELKHVGHSQPQRFLVFSPLSCAGSHNDMRRFLPGSQGLEQVAIRPVRQMVVAEN